MHRSLPLSVLVLLALVSPAAAEDALDLDATEAGLPAGTAWVDTEFSDEELSQVVLLAPPRLVGEESGPWAANLFRLIQESLPELAPVRVRVLEDVLPVEEVNAPLYYAGCPPGDELGCQFVLGEHAGVDRVISGKVIQGEELGWTIEVTVLSVAMASLEFQYRLELTDGEEDLVAESLAVTLVSLKKEGLIAPLMEAEEQAQAHRRAMERTQSEEERRIVARMEVQLREGELEHQEELLAREAERKRITEDDISAAKQVQGGRREWVELGISERQYLSYRNSGLDFDKWRWRWAGHRLQILGSIYFGGIGGATGQRYYGHTLSSVDGEGRWNQEDVYAWQAVTEGSAATIGLSIGLGILRNLDVEFSGFWASSRVYLKVTNGETTIDEETGATIPHPANRPVEDWQERSVSIWGGDLMFRYYLLTMPILRPTVGAGIAWYSYPSLYNDPDIADTEEQPTIAEDYPTFERLVEFGPQIEAGVQVDLGRHFGIFVRVPFTFTVSPDRAREHGTYPPTLIPDAEQMPGAPFGLIRVVVGVQGRLLGLPVRPKQTSGADDLLEEDA